MPVHHRSSIALACVVALVAGLLTAVATPATAAQPAAARASSAATSAGTLAPAAEVGQPPRSYVFPSGSWFSYPNRTTSERMAIRNRILYTIQSTWGGPRDPSNGVPLATNGKIRIATWSFNDWTIARALVAARNRGVSVQIVAADTANKDHAAWQYLRRSFGANLYRPGYPETWDRYSFARECRGSCRGAGGTPHSKFMLFDNVGSRHVRDVVVQTSANLTKFAVTGQWNEAQVIRSDGVHNDYRAIHRQMAIGRALSSPYHVKKIGNVVDFFFPYLGGRTPSRDPVMGLMRPISCKGSAVTGNGRTRIRIIQYAIYGERGAWLAKRLRYLWNAGCDIGIIYAVSSRPVLSILRNRSGRGPIPMRQSVVRNKRGDIVEYNHSKWMTIAGRWAGNSRTWLTFNGSANWSDPTFGNDEQMQRITGSPYVIKHNNAFTKTWREKSSKLPPGGRVAADGRTTFVLPEQPQWGTGDLRYLSPNGER
jgi:hypothetical protein